MTDKLEFHCAICSDNGERMGIHSRIGFIKRDALALPLDGSMFDSPDPDRGVAAPWAQGVPWDRMLHFRHLPWGLDAVSTPDAMAQGGPDRLLTDQGWMTISQIQTVKPAPAIEVPTIPLDQFALDVPPSEAYKCPKCGKGYVVKGHYDNHVKHCKR